MNPATATYQNLYAIIIVVTAFVATDNAMPAVVREVLRFEFISSIVRNDSVSHIRSPTVSPKNI